MKRKYFLVGMLIWTVVLAGCANGGEPLVPADNSGVPVETVAKVNPDVAVVPGQTVTSPRVKPNQTVLDANLPGKVQTLTPAGELSKEKALVIATINPGLVDFIQGKFDNLKGNSQEALFFSSKACASCRDLEKRIKEDELFLPGGMVVFKVDVGKEAELTKKYEARAGLMVIFDSSGKEFGRVDVGDLGSVALSLRKVME